MAIPTKTLLAISQFSGRWCSFWRVPLQVFRTSFTDRALLRYLFLLMSMWSHSSLSFRMAVRWFLTSCGSGCLFRILSSSSRSLLHCSFHRRKAHSDVVMRKSQVAPGLGVPSGDLILRRGRAVIDDMSKPCGQSMCFMEHISLMIFHV